MLYTIKPGDSLSALAKKYNTSVEFLAWVNGIDDPSKINVGETFFVPSVKYMWEVAKRGFKKVVS